MTTTTLSSLQRKAAFYGAVLLVISFATGALLAGAMTNKVPADPHSISAAHLSALFGCFWLCALAFTLPFVQFSDKGLQRLVWCTVIPSYANWLITVIKAFLHVLGVGLDRNGSNNMVFGLLNAFVVLPSFAAAIAWAYGLFKASGRGDRGIDPERS